MYPRASIQDETAGPGTVLVVEDDEDVLDAVVAALATRNYRVVTARDGARALTILAGVKVDLILLDLTMPVMSGWEFLEAKCADPQLLQVPVVVVTAIGSSVRDADDPPWVEVVEKPFRLQGLLDAVARHIRHARRSA